MVKCLTAQPADLSEIWKLLQEAIIRRKEDGSSQWQDGYPNIQSLENDIKSQNGLVFWNEGEIAGYAALIFEIEPAYEELHTWEKGSPYAVVHRVAVGNKFLNKGIATEIFRNIENSVVQHKIESIRVDTNFDNYGMLRIFDKLNYIYRGEVYFRGSARKAFEKELA